VNVASILALKGPVIVTVKPTDTIATLSRKLHEKRVGAAVVSSDGQALDGVISERDIAYAVAVHKGDLHVVPVETLMTRAVISCAPGDSVAHVASTMLSRRIRHVPVVDDGRLLGMISIRDVLNQRLDDLQRQTAMLRNLAVQMDVPPQDR